MGTHDYGEWFPGDRQTAEGSVWRNDLLGDVNLACFLYWITGATAIPVQTRYGPLRVLECTRPQCHRCGTGLGGYSFGWEDKRWTPFLAVVDESRWGSPLPSPNAAREECLRTPWPRGSWRKELQQQ